MGPFTNDHSRLCYRVMTHRGTATTVLAGLEMKDRYQISYNEKHPKYCERGYWREGNAPCDGFRLR